MAVGTVAGQQGRQGHGRGGGNGNQPLEQQLQKVRQATKQYEDFEQALEDGYSVLGPYAPGKGLHLINIDHVVKGFQQGPNLVEPQLLTYSPDFELGAVQYSVPVYAGSGYHKGKRSYDLFNDETVDGASEDWSVDPPEQHVFSNGNDVYDPEAVTTEQLINDDNWYILSDVKPEYPGTVPSLEAGDQVSIDGEELIVDRLEVKPLVTTLHVWLHYENPDGVFAPFNPALDNIYEG